MVVVQKQRNLGSELSGSAAAAQKVRRGDISHAVVVRTKKKYGRPDGSFVRFDDNACVLINKAGDPMGTRLNGMSPLLRLRRGGPSAGLAGFRGTNRFRVCVRVSRGCRSGVTGQAVVEDSLAGARPRVESQVSILHPSLFVSSLCRASLSPAATVSREATMQRCDVRKPQMLPPCMRVGRCCGASARRIYSCVKVRVAVLCGGG